MSKTPYAIMKPEDCKGRMGQANLYKVCLSDTPECPYYDNTLKKSIDGWDYVICLHPSPEEYFQTNRPKIKTLDSWIDMKYAYDQSGTEEE